jgi:YebC/PmpR family DNA-binding regulatory protein
MGRIFETRKATMFARWDKMAKAFTRINKDIAIAVKSGGASAESNPALRRALQNARAMNMPKDKVENAIKRASGQGVESYEEVLYEGYGPHGVAILVETATDNTTRTVANLRSIFNKKGGNLGSSGSVSYMFHRMGVFRLRPDPALDLESLELDLIDHGLQEMGEGTNDKGEPQLIFRCAFNDFGQLQKAMEERKLQVVSVESEYIAENLIDLGEAEGNLVLELVDKIEQDDDVQKVFHNLR